MGEKIVIIGSVAAGPKAACHAKRLLPDAEITILDMDNLISYGGCGIPYYVSGDVPDEEELRQTSFHMTRDEDFFQDAKGVHVRTLTRATAIDRKEKCVLVEHVKTGEKDSIPYDKVVLATGATPFVLPIPGADIDGVYTISDLHNPIDIKQQLATGKIGKAVVIGGGAIGLEMAEAFTDLWGVETSVLEFMPQLLPRLVDPWFSTMLINHMQSMGVHIYTGEGASEIVADENGRACKVITPNRTLETDIVIMATGVRPRTQLAEEAGLLVSPFGIIVNDRLQTSDPNIYAAGDCIEVTHMISGQKFTAPLGSLANREGRIVGDNLAGIPTKYPGAMGSFIMKAFERCIGATGLSFDSAIAAGFDAGVAIATPSDRAHFFPTEAKIPIQMVFDKRTRQVLGVQGFGPMSDAVLARIDASAALIGKQGTIDDFSILEMAYAPPFATALDALNTVANVADNLQAGRQRDVPIPEFLAWMDDHTMHPDWAVLDIRHPNETGPFKEKFSDIWVDLVYNEIREKYESLPTDKTFIIICDAGTRSYEMQIFLDSVGLHDTLVLSGGFNLMIRIEPDWWPRKKQG